jgi:hypothetical protein
MPVHDYICEPCDVFLPDQYHPLLSAILCCPDCGVPCDKSWHRDSRPLFHAFTVDYGSGPTEITSLSQIRSIERESERSVRRDPKGQPYVFRAYSQDHSNRDVNTLASEGVQQQKPKKQANVNRSKKPL